MPVLHKLTPLMMAACFFNLKPINIDTGIADENHVRKIDLYFCFKNRAASKTPRRRFKMGIFNFKYAGEAAVPRPVKIWLVIGLFMLFMQIVIGGITRLTGSGLSITKWEIVTGTLPPLNEAAWLDEFDKYKATPQYQKINAGMSLGEFKFIYFWEYLHRLWARWMGVVFAVPFVWFLRRGMLPRSLVGRLGGVIGLAAVAASFGWIMVASGLVNRPWVNAYKLTLHLTIGFSVFAWLLWAALHVFQPTVPKITSAVSLKKWTLGISLLALVQFMLGGVMSGMKAGLFFPTWPDMNGAYLPGVLLDANQWNVENFVNYDSNPFMPALIHVLHRNTAYLLTIMVLWLFFHNLKAQSTPIYRTGNYMLITVLVTQVLLGILTVVNCKAHIPVGLGELHQMGGVLLLAVLIFMNYQLRRSSPK